MRTLQPSTQAHCKGCMGDRPLPWGQAYAGGWVEVAVGRGPPCTRAGARMRLCWAPIEAAARSGLSGGTGSQLGLRLQGFTAVQGMRGTLVVTAGNPGGGESVGATRKRTPDSATHTFAAPR